MSRHRIKILLLCLLFTVSACQEKNETFPGLDTFGVKATITPIPEPEPTPEPEPEPEPNRDEKLKSLTVSPGTLNNAFSPNTQQYFHQVESAVSKLTIKASLFSNTSKLWANGTLVNSDQNFTIDLETGDSIISLLVVALNGISSQYKLVVNRIDPSEDLPVGPGSGTAISMAYYLMKNRQKFIALAAYSDKITYQQAIYGDNSSGFGVRYRDAIIRWTILNTPDNGTLYDAKQEITDAPYALSSPDELLYIPNNDFSGIDGLSFSVRDSTGESNIGNVFLLVENAITLPAGIATLPDIFNTPAPTPTSNVDVETADWYIDNSHNNASDTSRSGENSIRHGTPDTPRLTLPPSTTTFTENTKVFIHGGIDTPYTLQNNTSHNWVLAGTTGKPVYIIGANNSPLKPIIEHNGAELRLDAEYAIIEGLHFKGPILQDSQLNLTNGNIVMRHNIIDGLSQGTEGAALRLNIGNTKVLYDMHIKNAGKTESDLVKENSVHGIQSTGVNDYWVIDSLLHDHAGDAIQIDGNFSTNLYIARNKIHSNNDNALDLSRHYEFMFMENDVWDYRAISYKTSESKGIAININQQPNNPTSMYSTIARNRIWDSNTAIQLQGQFTWTTDNTIWNIYHNENTNTPKYAIEIGNNGAADYYDRITNNTFYNIDAGIWVWATDNSNIKDHQFKGNIFSELNPESLEKIHYRISNNHTAGTTTNYNLYATPLKVLWGSDDSTNTLDMTSYRASTSNPTASFNDTDPLFFDTNSASFRLLSISPAIGSNIEHIIYDEFKTKYGKPLNIDMDLTPRPANGSWDIGAYER